MLVSKKTCQHQWKIVRVAGSRFALAGSKNVGGIASCYTPLPERKWALLN
jgi:hypothetical protein